MTQAITEYYYSTHIGHLHIFTFYEAALNLAVVYCHQVVLGADQHAIDKRKMVSKQTDTKNKGVVTVLNERIHTRSIVDIIISLTGKRTSSLVVLTTTSRAGDRNGEREKQSIHYIYISF